jgi:hypothetical protein
MASHTNGAGYGGDSGEHEVATPYNRPRPQWDVRSPVPVDPTSALLAEGGTLTMNDRDRTALADWFQANFDGRFQGGLHKWFQDSFKNQFQFKVSWWTTDWFPKFFGPIRDRINENFDKAFESIRKNDEEVVRLRTENATLKKEMHDWVNKKDVEFGREVLKLRNENLSLKRELMITMQTIVDDKAINLRAENATLRSDMRREIAEAATSKNREFNNVIQKLRVEAIEGRNDILKDCALATEAVVDVMMDRVRKEFAGEIFKIQNEVADVKKGFEVTKIVAEAARVTEEGFIRLKKELATEIAKGREEARREARKATAKPAPAAGSKKS